MTGGMSICAVHVEGLVARKDKRAEVRATPCEHTVIRMLYTWGGSALSRYARTGSIKSGSSSM